MSLLGDLQTLLFLIEDILLLKTLYLEGLLRDSATLTKLSLFFFFFFCFFFVFQENHADVCIFLLLLPKTRCAFFISLSFVKKFLSTSGLFRADTLMPKYIPKFLFLH